MPHTLTPISHSENISALNPVILVAELGVSVGANVNGLVEQQQSQSLDKWHQLTPYSTCPHIPP